MRCNRLLQRSTFGTTEKELIKGSNLRHFNGSFSCWTGVDKASTQMNEAFCPRDRHCECEGAPNRSFWKSFLRKSFGGTKVRHYGVQTVRRQALSAGVEFIRMVFAQKFGSGERFENVLCLAGRFFAAALRILKFPLHCSIFVPKINTGEHQLPQHKSGYLHRIKRKLRAVSPYGLFFVRFRQSRSWFKTLKFQSHARTFQVRSGICFLIPCAAFPVSLLIPPCSY